MHVLLQLYGSTILQVSYLKKYITVRLNMSGSPKPTLADLDRSLNKLVNWEKMAIYLPKIDQSDVGTIKKENQNLAQQKLALCTKWLSVYPDASWEDVNDALREAEENTLAKEIAQVHVSNKSNKKTAGNKALTDTVMVKEEVNKEVVNEIESLHSNFLDLAMDVETEFKRRLSLGEIKLDYFLARLKYWRNIYGITKITKIETIDEFFEKVSECYTFLDYDLLKDIASKFPDALDLQKKLEDYKIEVTTFWQTAPIEKLKDKLAPLVTQFYTNHTSLLIVFKLQNAWGKKPIALFEILLETLYPTLSDEMKWYKVQPGSICIIFSAPNDIFKAVISSSEYKIDFMRLVGVFNLQISDDTVLNGDENEDYSFELAFLEASLTCNLDAIKFLLVIGVNVDYTNEKGKTALLVASEQGHKEMVNCLIAANADVNASDVDSRSALIIASENNDVELAQILLNAKANPNHQRNDGNTSLHIASYNNYNELAVMLIEFGAEPLIKNTKGDTPFLSSFRTLTDTVMVEEDMVIEIGTLHSAGNRASTDTVMVEEEVVMEMECLYSDFLVLATQVETEFKRLLSLGKINLDSILARLKYGQNVYGIAEITSIETIDDFLNEVSGCCTFLNCDLLEDIASNLPDAFNLRKRFRDHKRKVRTFSQATPIEKLKNKLAPLVTQFRIDHTSLLIVFKLQNVWGQKPIALFEMLLETLFPKLSDEMKWYKVEPGSICITFSAHGCISKDLVSSSEHRAHFMRLVGVFNLQISDDTVLNGDENEDYSFELAFLEASLTCNLDAIKFLLVIGVNVDYTNEKGKTALLIASQQGNKEMVNCLIAANADVNTSDVDSRSALIIASENNDVELAQILLNAKANPNHQRNDGNTSLHIASYNNYNKLAVMLIEFGADPLIENTKGDTPFLSSTTTSANKVAQVHVSKKNNKKTTGNRTFTDTVMVEEEVVIEMESLHSYFLDLAMNVETEFKRLSSLGKIKLDSFLTRLKYDQNVYRIAEITNIETIDEFFNAVSRCCTFLDCDLLEDIANNLPDTLDLQKQLRDHKRKVRHFLIHSTRS